MLVSAPYDAATPPPRRRARRGDRECKHQRHSTLGVHKVLQGLHLLMEKDKLGIVLIVPVIAADRVRVVLVVVLAVDDAVPGPSGLFTLTGRISYRLTT